MAACNQPKTGGRRSRLNTPALSRSKAVWHPASVDADETVNETPNTWSEPLRRSKQEAPTLSRGLFSGTAFFKAANLNYATFQLAKGQPQPRRAHRPRR